MPEFKKNRNPILMKATKGGPIHKNYASPIKGFKIKPKKSNKPTTSLVSGGMSDEDAKKLAIEGGFGPRKIPVGPRQE